MPSAESVEAEPNIIERRLEVVERRYEAWRCLMRLETSVCFTLIFSPLFILFVFLTVEYSAKATFFTYLARADGSQLILFFGFVWALSQIRPRLIILGTLFTMLFLAQLFVPMNHLGTTSGLESRLIIFVIYPALLIPLVVFAVRISRSTPNERELVALNKRDTFGLGSAFQALVGVPPSCIYLPSRIRRTAACSLFVFSQLFFGVSVTFTLVGSPAFLLMLGPAIGLRNLAKRFCSTSLELMVRSDPRPSILFLRSFSDDQVRLRRPKRNFLAFIVLMGEPFPTLDQVLLEEGTEKGPVVAIGAPGSRPPFGAARAYVSDDDWKQVVSELAQTSQTIVMALDATEGIEWELAELHLNEHTPKVLHLLPPRFSIASEARELIRKVRTSLPQIAGHLTQVEQFLETNERPCLGWHSLSNGRLVMYTTTRVSDASYRLAIRDYLITKENELSRGLASKIKPFSLRQMAFLSFVTAVSALSAVTLDLFFTTTTVALGVPYVSRSLVVAWMLISVSLFIPAIAIVMGLLGLFDRSSNKIFAILGMIIGAAVIALTGAYADVPKIIHLLLA